MSLTHMSLVRMVSFEKSAPFRGHALKDVAMEVRVANVRKEFDRFPALHDVPDS